MAKLIMKIPSGYSRSSDKVREHLLKDAQPDVKQFLVKNNPLQFIDPTKLRLQLKDDEEKKTVETATPAT